MSKTYEGFSKLCFRNFAGTNATRRQRIAWWLRKLADKIDGERSWSVYMDALPPVPIHETDRIIEKGLLHSRALAKEIVRAELADRAAVAALPDDKDIT